jgi:diaminopimelate decarboxylase
VAGPRAAPADACAGAREPGDPGAIAGARLVSAPALGTRPAFPRVEGRLCCEGVSLEDIARDHGTPVYVYSRSAIESAYARYRDALAGREAMVCFAVKANPSLAILALLARAGAGFDIVSGGELARALAAGADPARIVFSGVGKTEDEMEAGLLAGIGCFNVESAAELAQLRGVASRLGARAPVALRVNPDVDPKTHRYISTGLKANKFGVPADEAEALTREAARDPCLEVAGVAFHIGSQISSVEPYLEAVGRVLDLVDRLATYGISPHRIDLGGGLGIAYRGEELPSPASLVAALLGCLDRRGHGRRMLVLEPGRSIVGPAGALVTRVQSVKQGAEKRFAIVDAGMNDLLRPALYEAWMEVAQVGEREGPALATDVVGPVCESADWLARDRSLCVEGGDLLAVLDCGAYGMSMASNYNSRGRAAEVMVDGTRARLIRRRETVADLMALESTFNVL